jgi:hypothetical protein
LACTRSLAVSTHARGTLDPATGAVIHSLHGLSALPIRFLSVVRLSERRLYYQTPYVAFGLSLASTVGERRPLSARALSS